MFVKNGGCRIEAKVENRWIELEGTLGALKTGRLGPVRQVDLMEDFVLDDWPDKQDGDVAWVYVGLIGDSYVEAVSVVLAKEAGVIRIRQLEWGRP